MNQNQPPLVSVLMTVYNREKYLAEAIESVLSCTYQNWELIITDDQSQDRSFEIAKQYELKDDRIKVYLNEKNLGDYPNRNRVASYAQGKYIKYLDADDIIYKHSLEIMVEYMENNPEAAIGLSNNIIDDFVPYPSLSYPIQTLKCEYLKKSILGCGPSASIIKREIFNITGGFSEKRYVGDHEFWLKVAAIYPILKFQPALVWWRQHDEQQIVLERNDHIVLDIRYQLSKKTLESNKTFFNEDEYCSANNRMKQNYARSLLFLLIKKRNTSMFITLFKASKLTIGDLITGFKGYIQ